MTTTDQETPSPTAPKSSLGRRLLRLLLASLLLLALVFLAGPRPHVDARYPALPALPKDLDSFLAASEAKVPGIVPGTEKSILWAEPGSKKKTPLALVFLHGFSATRQELSPLCEDAAKVLGANLFMTRLRGHGRGAEEMGEATVEDWIRDGAEALALARRLGEKTVLIGCSTGGTLALWLAVQPEAKIDALVLVSPNMMPRDGRARLLTMPWGGQLVRLLAGPYVGWTPRNPLQRRFWTSRYRCNALVTMQALVDLARGAPLEKLQSPLLTFYSLKDQVINPAEVEATLARMNPTIKEVIRVDDADDRNSHVLAGRILSPGPTPRMTAELVRFIRSSLAAVPSPTR